MVKNSYHLKYHAYTGDERAEWVGFDKRKMRGSKKITTPEGLKETGAAGPMWRKAVIKCCSTPTDKKRWRGGTGAEGDDWGVGGQWQRWRKLL